MSQSPLANRDAALPPAEQPVAANPAPPRQSWAHWQSLKDALPTAVTVAALVGLAAWGHSSDWTLPKFSALLGNRAAQVADWCDEHNVPESQCIECNKHLVAAGPDYGWCQVHGVAQCPLEHPEVAQLKTIPAITADEIERARRALALRPRAENNSRCTLARAADSVRLDRGGGQGGRRHCRRRAAADRRGGRRPTAK